MAQEWVEYRCPKCSRLHEVPAETVAYLCGGCHYEISLEPEPEEEGDSEDE